jgi:hypothetical protein
MGATIWALRLDPTQATSMDIEVSLAAQGSARDAGAAVYVYILPSVDGSNYSYGADATDPSDSSQVVTFAFDAATTARRVVVQGVPIYSDASIKLFGTQ